MIQKLDFAEPFFQVEYVEQEENYWAKGRCLIFNLAGQEEEPVRIETFPLESFCSAVVCDVALEIQGRALVIQNFGDFTVETDAAAKQLKQSWKSLWEYSHLERNRNVPYYKSPRMVVGGDTGMNFCFAEANAPSALHREHGEDFDEVHLQVCGSGRVQIFRDEDAGTLYQEFPLSPGNVNGKIWNKKGEYPWHRYHSTTRSVFVVIEKTRDRGGKK